MKNKVCSHCGKDVSDFYIKLNLITSIYRKRSDGIEEKIENSELSNIEILCKDCLNLFAETFDNF